ncbi:LysR family transcriptional regulator [Bradyrhizobium liaoningense]
MRPNELSMRLLQVFEEVYRTRSVSRAATELDISQPAISLALVKLRSHFHDPLFVRTSLGMEPTPFSQELISSVRNALRMLEKALGTTQKFHPFTATRRFTISMTDITQMLVLPLLLELIKSEAPGVTLGVARITGQSGRALESGEVDLVVGYVPSIGSGIYQRRLLMRDFVCIASSRHPRIRRTLSLSTFNAEGHLVVTASGSGLQHAEKVLGARRVKRRILLQVPDLLGLDRLVGETELVATVPRPVGLYLALEGRVRVFEHPVKIPGYPVKLHWHERFHHDPANQWFRSLLAEIMGPPAELIKGLREHR